MKLRRCIGSIKEEVRASNGGNIDRGDYIVYQYPIKSGKGRGVIEHDYLGRLVKAGSDWVEVEIFDVHDKYTNADKNNLNKTLKLPLDSNTWIVKLDPGSLENYRISRGFEKLTKDLTEYNTDVYAWPGDSVAGSIGDASFIGHDGKMQGNSKKPVYKTPKSSIHYKKGKFAIDPDFDEDDNIDYSESSYAYGDDRYFPKDSIHNPKNKNEQLGIPTTPSGMIDGGPRKMKVTNKKKIRVPLPKQVSKIQTTDRKKYDRNREKRKNFDEQYLTFDYLNKHKDECKNGFDANEKIRKQIEKENTVGTPMLYTVEYFRNLTNNIIKERFPGLSEEEYVNRHDEFVNLLVKEMIDEQNKLFNDSKDYDDNVVPKNSIHFGERDRVKGQPEMKFEDKYLSDKEIDSTYENYDVKEFKLNSSGMSGSIYIEFPKRESVLDYFIIYNDGKIAFENWYPDEIYFGLVNYIYKNINNDIVKQKIKKSIAGKGYQIMETIMNSNNGTKLNKSVMNLTPETNVVEPITPVPQRTFGDTPDFPYKDENNDFIIPIPGEGIAKKTGDSWTFGDTPKMSDVQANPDSTSIVDIKPTEILPGSDSCDFGEIDLPCTKKPLIKKFLLMLKKEQKNLQEGIPLKGIYDGKIVKLNTITEGDKRRFKAYVKNENKIYKVNFGPEKNESCGNLDEKSVSKAQQKAAAIALSAKRGDTKVSDLGGASKQMHDSMSTSDLEDFARTKHSGLPQHVK